MDCITLFTAYLVNEKLKLSTIKSYISGIKGTLAEDGIEIPDNNFTLNALMRACRLRNDKVMIRLPIHKDLLKLILSQLEKTYATQPYLLSAYSVIFSSAYCGMLRIGELTEVTHTVSISDGQRGVNKNKILFTLKSSKTHCEGDKPQRIKIESHKMRKIKKKWTSDRYCPFELMNQYIKRRPLAVSA